VFYTAAEQLRNVIPKENSGRLFILSRKWKGYARLKLMYYLLPLNIYNYGDYPITEMVHPKDLIFVFDSNNKISFEPKSNILHTGINRSLNVDLIYKNSLGALYIARNSYP